MYIIYDNNLYRYLDDDCEILTYDETKINKEFEEDDGIFYKKISSDDPQIESIYDVKFYVYWDSQLENVEKNGE